MGVISSKHTHTHTHPSGAGVTQDSSRFHCVNEGALILSPFVFFFIYFLSYTFPYSLLFSVTSCLLLCFILIILSWILFAYLSCDHYLDECFVVLMLLSSVQV